MSTSKETQNHMLQYNLYYNDKDELHHVNPVIDDIISDIAFGICKNQSLDYDGNIKLGDKNVKLHNQEFKTDIIKEVNSIVFNKLQQIHEDNRWKGETEFVADGSTIKLIEYPTYGDSCTIQFDDRVNTTKITKRCFSEWYEGRDNI